MKIKRGDFKIHHMIPLISYRFELNDSCTMVFVQLVQTCIISWRQSTPQH